MSVDPRKSGGLTVTEPMAPVPTLATRWIVYPVI
jgi:hypothetical protein